MQQFGKDDPVDYARVVATLQGVQPRALTPDQIDDVALMMDWMKQELLRQHEELVAKRNVLLQKEAELNRRDKELATRSRVLATAAGIVPAPKRWGYFTR